MALDQLPPRPLPPLDLVAPDGAPVTVTGLGGDATLSTLAGAFGVTSLHLAGATATSIDSTCPLVEIDEVRVGVRVVDDDPDRGVLPPAPPLVNVSVVSGPACTLDVGLPAGRHVIGRAPHAGLVVDDPLVEWHHALLDVAPDGTIAVTQLAGRVPIGVENAPRTGGHRHRGRCRVRLGATTLDVSVVEHHGASATPTAPPPSVADGSIRRHPTDPWRRVVWRAPDLGGEWGDPAIAAPAVAEEPGPPASTGLVGAAIAVAGALAIAVLLDNPVFALFAIVGAGASLGTWLVGWIGVARRRRRIRRAAAADLVRFVDELEASARACRRDHERRHRCVGVALRVALDLDPAVWSRRLRRGDDGPDTALPLVATVGHGTLRRSPTVTAVADDHRVDRLIEQHGRLERVAAPLSIDAGEVVAVHGPADVAASVTRSIVVQLATWFGPADWRLVIVTDAVGRWAWADWLPHAAEGVAVVDATDGARLADELAAVDTAGRMLVVTDAPGRFAARTGPLRRFLERSGAAALVVVDRDMTVPAICARVVSVGATGRATWIGSVPSTDDAIDIEVAGITCETAELAARSLACLVDPEDDRAGDRSVPERIGLADVADGVGASAARTSVEGVVQAWESAGPDPAPCAVIGRSGDGVVEIDLVRDGPHGLVAGTTGSGKSELLRSLVVGLALTAPPTQLNLVLVDYKGGSSFDACIGLPHTVGVVTDLDEGLAERALASLTAELQRRERLLRDVGATDLTDYRRVADRPPIARLVVVIDEFAALAVELPDFLSALVGVAQRGRSLGVHLVLATQRPAGVVNDDIRANTDLRLALRLNDRADALDVVGDGAPASFPRRIPGRAALRLGPDELIVFQSVHCTGPARPAGRPGPVIERRRDTETPDDSDPADGQLGPSELNAAVAAVVGATERLGLPAAHRPWLDPLPFPLDASGGAGAAEERCPPGAVGLLDDPAGQRRRALSWTPADGHLALVGAHGSGTTSTLIALATATCLDRSPGRVHLYVIDGRGDAGLHGLTGIAHCGGVVGIDESERLHRLLHRLAAELDRRRGATGGLRRHGEASPEIVLGVDGWSTLRAELAAFEHGELGDVLRRLAVEGPPLGIVIVSTDDATASAFASPATDRWIFHLDDPASAQAFGTRPVAPGRPGRLRVASSGLEGQVARGAAGLATIAGRDVDRSGPPTIGVLPEIVGIDDVVDGRRRSVATEGGHSLLVGLGGDDLEPDHLRADRRDPIVVVGGPRTGVSCALERLVASWCSAHGCDADAVVRVDRFGVTDAVAAALTSDASRGRQRLVVIDDAHRVDDPTAVLTSIARGDQAGVTMLVGARADAVRTAYGHWVREAAKARCGIVMSSRGDPDGDVLGVVVPRRPLVAARRGLGWIVDDGPLRQVQVAIT